MELDKLIISTQAKSSWQCFDLACKLSLRFYPKLLAFWLLVSAPFLAVGLGLSLEFGVLIFWLFKPWYERGLLFILSREIFSERVSLWQALKKWPSLLKARFFSSVSYARLAPSRSFDAPVSQLEGLKGKARSQRLQVLHRSRDDNSAWWTICCAHWEVFLLIAILFFAKMMLPESFDSLSISEVLTSQTAHLQLAYAICMYISAAIVAPFYVAGGFIAYLNRRVILEAWDIELGFKKWAGQHAQHASRIQRAAKDSAKALPQTQNRMQSQSKLIIGFALIFSLGLSDLGQSASAQSFNEEQPVKDEKIDPIPFSELPKELQEVVQKDREAKALETQLNDSLGDKGPKQIRENLDKVLQEAPFHRQTETVTGYRWKSSKPTEQDAPPDLDWLGQIIRFIAGATEIIFWVFFVFVLGYLIWANRAMLASAFKSENSTTKVDIPSFASSDNDEALPDNVLDAIQQAIEQDKLRDALSLMLRDTLTQLVSNRALGMLITSSMTESECLHEIRSKGSSELTHFMQALLNTWSHLAWAHRMPSSSAVKTLSNNYQGLFSERQASSSVAKQRALAS